MQAASAMAEVYSKKNKLHHPGDAVHKKFAALPSRKNATNKK
ncbi:hypothetical protein [Alkalicoccus saliphilus]|nr:hypothetical protein [Alkalicoccus saliphilus]